MSSIFEAAPDDWLRDGFEGELYVQTLFQQHGHAMTLVATKGTDDDDDEMSIEDTATRFGRY